MTKFLPEAELIKAVQAVRESPSKVAAAEMLGWTRGKLEHHIREAKRRKVTQSPQFQVAALPSYQATAEEIIQRKFRIFNRRKRAKDARDLIPVKVKIDGPIGILHMGDPHLDDDGTNIKLVMEHLDLPSRVDGLFLACVGDYLNNWRGKLAPLHASQSTTQQEAHKLLEWFIKRDKWLYLIAGNHDVWAGDEDPLIWMTRGLGAIYEWHGARVALRFPGGAEHIVNVRHEWPGSSIYNRVQGATRAIRFGGTDDLFINGHKHIWGHYEEENSAGGVSHAVQVSAYKEIDDYQQAKGFARTSLGAACMTIHNPNARTPHGRCAVYWDVEEGADFLKFLRGSRVALQTRKVGQRRAA